MLILGDAGVGKTCLLTRFVDNVFDEKEVNIMTNSKIKEIPAKGNQTIRLEFLDTAGQEKFRTLTSSFYRQAQGVFLCFDLTDLASYQSLPMWAHEVQYYFNSASSYIAILVGNKSDLETTTKVDKEEIKAFVSSNNYKGYFECSAKTGDGCDAALNCLVENIRLLNSDLMRSQETVDLTASPKKPQKEGKGFCTLL